MNLVMGDSRKWLVEVCFAGEGDRLVRHFYLVDGYPNYEEAYLSVGTKMDAECKMPGFQRQVQVQQILKDLIGGVRLSEPLVLEAH
ncbi:hypothetical protein AB0F77_22655 [Streptomyces sp. NPDC026672]|uniref:hypothetical protein n=1 Tax=unclassified Streptomyces TaxID=2593676 RepID=UPI0033D5D7FD